MKTAKSTIGLLEALQDRDGVYHTSLTVEQAIALLDGDQVSDLDCAFDEAQGHVVQGLGPAFLIIRINQE